jgi:ribosomal protein L21E
MPKFTVGDRVTAYGQTGTVIGREGNTYTVRLDVFSLRTVEFHEIELREIN